MLALHQFPFPAILASPIQAVGIYVGNKLRRNQASDFYCLRRASSSDPFPGRVYPWSDLGSGLASPNYWRPFFRDVLFRFDFDA